MRATSRRACRPASTCATAWCAAASCAWTRPSIAGAVRVEIDFDETLPTQARADLSVDGTIAIETLEERALRRPPGRRAVRFRARRCSARSAGDNVAERVPVKFGKASVNQIVVLEGLEPGDIVALADTTQWSGKDRLVID